MPTPKQPVRTEVELRDYLAANLDLIEPGLSLVAKERFLRNDKGAAGFIDIFARSMSGQFVIIEIKRSNAAARQAIHEIVKYAALVKQNLLVKETEFRLVIMSTDWDELHLPFSEFVRGTRFACEGRRILLDKNGLPASSEPMGLAPPEQPRRISRRHFIWGFDNEPAARAAIPILANYMQGVGLTDFVVALLSIRGCDDENQRFLYFAQQELSLDAYMALIRSRFSAETVVEFEGFISELTEHEDKVSEAADKVWEDISFKDGLYVGMGATHAQIAYPEKARHWFDATALVSCEIERFGRFVDNALSDELIVRELVGDGGESFFYGNVSANLESKPEVDALLGVSDNLFFFNPTWRVAVRDLCDYAKRTGGLSVQLRAFSNEDIFRSLAGLAIGYAGYVPTFQFDVRRADGIETYIGVINWAGCNPDFAHLVANHFEGDSFGYFVARHFGANRGQNADLMTDMGLSYSVARATPQGPAQIRIHGASISEVRSSAHRPLIALLQENPNFASALIEFFLRHEQEFGRLFSKQALEAAELNLESMKTPPAETVFWTGDVDSCDICQRDLSGARFMVDGSVQGGAWACMCALCFQQVGGFIGWGQAQLYERADGGWLLVGGGPPESEVD